MLYNGVFGCHGNTCYVIFVGAIFYMIYSTGKINVCTDFEINRFRIDGIDAKTHVTQKRFETNQKSLRLPVQKLWLK